MVKLIIIYSLKKSNYEKLNKIFRKNHCHFNNLLFNSVNRRLFLLSNLSIKWKTDRTPQCFMDNEIAY